MRSRATIGAVTFFGGHVWRREYGARHMGEKTPPIWISGQSANWTPNRARVCDGGEENLGCGRLKWTSGGLRHVCRLGIHTYITRACTERNEHGSRSTEDRFAITPWQLGYYLYI